MTATKKDYKLEGVDIDEIEYKEPLELFALLREEASGPAFLLGGGGGGGGGESRRYSYMGFDPFMVIEDPDDPFGTLSETLKKYKTEAGPFPFSGGGVGYFSYDLKEKIFTKAGEKETLRKDPLVPASIIALYDVIVAIDHMEKKTYIVDRGAESAKGLSKKIQELAKSRKAITGAGLEDFPAPSTPRSNLTRDEYISRVVSAKRYITEGDIYQINIAQKFEIPLTRDPFSLYKAIVEESPAPFSSFMDFGSFQIISNTPERLLKIEAGFALTQPIKGTRKRGATGAEDLALIKELRESPKERAEHVMIVDLERNDLGRICETGSVTVEGFEEIMTLTGLHHMVSSVKGRVKQGLSGPECLKAIFPGGSITGAPKIRAMEIIDELEPEARGLYTGALGWMDFSGDLDFSMAIRTAVSKDSTLHLSVGSGIVADSIPEEEYDETILKAGDFFNAILAGENIA